MMWHVVATDGEEQGVVCSTEGRFFAARKTTKREAGFTLLELLLVLAVLVAITSVTIPVVGRLYDAHRVQRAAAQVQTALSAARLRAVDSGIAFECRYEPEGRQLVVLARGARGSRFGSDATDAAAGPQRRFEPIQIELPEPLYFWTADNARERLDTRALRGLNADHSWSNRRWSSPITFASNGTSTDAQFEIRDAEGRAVRLEVRGLTGAASTSKLVTGSSR